MATEQTEALWADAVDDVAWVVENLAKHARFVVLLSPNLAQGMLNFSVSVTSVLYLTTTPTMPPLPRRSDAVDPSNTFVLTPVLCPLHSNVD